MDMPAASASWLVNDAAVSMGEWLFLRSCFQFFQIRTQKWHSWSGDSPISITVKLFCIPITRDKSSDFSKTPLHGDFLFNGILRAWTLISRTFKGSPTPDSNSECQIRHRVTSGNRNGYDMVWILLTAQIEDLWIFSPDSRVDSTLLILFFLA